jgi:hypothetical protein
VVKAFSAKIALLITPLLITGCGFCLERIFIPIMNFTDATYYLTVIVDSRIMVENRKISGIPEGRNFFSDTIDRRAFLGTERPIFFIFQLRHKKDAEPFLEDTLYFPGGGIATLTRTGGFAVIVHIMNIDNNTKLLFSQSP